MALCAAIVAATTVGCGAPAAPLPPTLNLPQPVTDLAARRAGNTVRLSFTVPQKTTDKLPVRGAMTTRLCRAVESGPCQTVGTLAIAAAQKAATIEDTLPPELTQGPPRLLVYRLAVLNRAARSAGDSAPAYAAAGPAPQPVVAFSATPRRNGIVLAWQEIPAPSGATVLVDRTRTSTPPSPPREQAEGNPLMGHGTPEEPIEQRLRVPEAALSPLGHASAIDITAHTGNTYRYIAQRVWTLTLAGHELELSSAPSQPVEVIYRDVFPPPIPIGLVSASDSAQKSIDLNWTPDVDPGLAGYIVYRRPADSSRPPERISSPGKPVLIPSWSDTTAQPGQRYAYSVSAIDASGNESQRSAEVEDQWNLPVSQPNPQP